MKKPRFAKEEKKLLEAGLEVEKGKYTYRIHGKYIEDSWHWVLQRAEKKDSWHWVLQRDEDWEDYEVIKEDKNVR